MTISIKKILKIMPLSIYQKADDLMQRYNDKKITLY